MGAKRPKSLIEGRRKKVVLGVRSGSPRHTVGKEGKTGRKLRTKAPLCYAFRGLAHTKGVTGKHKRGRKEKSPQKRGLY